MFFLLPDLLVCKMITDPRLKLNDFYLGAIMVFSSTHLHQLKYLSAACQYRYNALSAFFRFSSCVSSAIISSQ